MQFIYRVQSLLCSQLRVVGTAGDHSRLCGCLPEYLRTSLMQSRSEKDLTLAFVPYLSQRRSVRMRGCAEHQLGTHCRMLWVRSLQR